MARARWLLVLVACIVPGAAAAQLPSDAGQVWRTYDISAFVRQHGPGSQRHVVDWVLQIARTQGASGSPALPAVAADYPSPETMQRLFTRLPAMKVRRN